MAKRLAAMLAAVLASVSCTVHRSEAPPLSGPSEFALSLMMTATPDAISHDGGSQSAIRIAARGPDGRGISALPMRVDIVVNGVAQDFGTLSARTIVTGSDGTASVMYTAPRQVGTNTGTCIGLPGTCVDIVASAMGSNFQTANPQTVTVRLVPPGVILPPADTPTARFNVSPDPPAVGQPILFDATPSCPGPAADANNCQPSSSTISRFEWDFGDGTTASGATVSHSYSTARSYAVTLTVTNDRGVAASRTRTVELAPSTPPSASFVFSPTDPRPLDTVIFTETSRPVPGRTNVTFEWNFGDPDKPNGGEARGSTARNSYTREGSFVVTLTITDDLGQRAVATQTVAVKAAPTP
jgi:hypothetical protein